MRVLVLGNDVIGATSAYYLARTGHEVTVVGREAGPALETSFVNVGQISPDYASSWAAPGVPLKAIKWMFRQHTPLAIRPDGTLFQLKWMWQILHNCGVASYAQNKERMVRPAECSHNRIRGLHTDTGIVYKGRQQGILQISYTQQQLGGATNGITVLERADVPYELLSREDLVHSEPSLASTRHKLAGGLRLPNGGTGDCQLFTTCPATMTKELGVRFCLNNTVDSLIFKDDAVRSALVDGQLIDAGLVVVALDSYNTPFLKDLVNVPVCPLKGFSITMPMADAAKNPVPTILDEAYKVAVTHFGDHIRVGDMAQIVGYGEHLGPSKRETLEFVVNDLFPGAGDVSHASFQTGLRPMTPDGTPIVGQTPVHSLWLNTDHGTLGWAMACGSGKLLADLVSGRPPAIRSDDLPVYRYLGGTPMPTIEPMLA